MTATCSTLRDLWTAAHHDIPMLVVMFNNRSYYQDVGHQTAITRMRERSLERVGVGVSLEVPPPTSPPWPGVLASTVRDPLSSRRPFVPP